MNLRPRRPGGARRERRHPVVKNYPQPSWQLSELTSPRGLAAFQATSSEFDHSTARSHRLEAGAAAKATQRRHAHTHKTMEFRNLLNSARQITTIHPVSSNLTPSPLGSARVRNHRGLKSAGLGQKSSVPLSEFSSRPFWDLHVIVRILSRPS